MKMMPSLQAQEKLTAIDVAAFAQGAGTGAERARTIADLQRLAKGDNQVKKASARDLAGMGIGMRTAPPKQGLDNG
ncbi:MAG: hypothetical protein AAGK02_15060 [Pseudomonadota bacterium]